MYKALPYRVSSIPSALHTVMKHWKLYTLDDEQLKDLAGMTGWWIERETFPVVF